VVRRVGGHERGVKRRLFTLVPRLPRAISLIAREPLLRRPSLLPLRELVVTRRVSNTMMGNFTLSMALLGTESLLEAALFVGEVPYALTSCSRRNQA